ncbi:competence protein ComEC [Arcticibacter pallidicorallinus]|uniref:Competence protein ComEC n=1 Tax=Arcticibacter pallidicorallinus TaxID=1259464 RepID=A0A2T0U567_9SPHI|nr:ComEC/Rec2 family competence protein [Arcticibacter pallidicorallinus]PRY53034.1 competence protein ComEC [Arcticibacter pallidicorallinus]
MNPVDKHVFLRLLLPMTAGICACYYQAPIPTAHQWILVLTLLLMVFMLIVHIKYREYQLFLKPWLPGLLFQIFVCAAAFTHTGSFLLGQQKQHFSKLHAEQLLVEICSEPQEKSSVIRFEALVRSAVYSSSHSHAEGRLLISCLKDSSSKLNLTIGELLLVPANFSDIQGPANPGEFDYRSYMGNKCVWHQTFLTTAELTRVGETSGNLFYEAVKLRQKVVRKLEGYIVDREAAAVISTLLLGYKADLSREILNTYSATGVMHVLSVSGMHVAIVAALAGYLFGFWKGRKINIVQALLIVLFVWLYTLLSGLSAAACRSAVMISFVIAGRLINRNADMINCVSAAAFFQLLIRPFWLFDVGFQLSYIAVFGLVIFYPPIHAKLKFKSAAIQAIWSYIAFSLAAQVATFPLCLHYFNQFPVYFLASNLFIMLPVTVVMYAGVGFLLMAFFPPFASMPLRCLASVMEYGISLLNAGLRFIEKLPFSSLHGYHLHITFYMLIYVLIGFLFVVMTKRSKMAIWCTLILSLCIASIYTVSGLTIWKKKSVVFYAIRNHVAVTFNRRGIATVLSDMEVDDKSLAYSVMPLLRNRNLRIDKFVHLDGFLEETDRRASARRVRFQNLEFEIIDDECLIPGTPVPTSILDRSQHQVANSLSRKRIIFLHNNPALALPLFIKTQNIGYVVIGMKNTERNIDRWLTQADSLGIPCHSLKRSGALELDTEYF